MKSKVNFKRDGLTLIGDLYTPNNFDENGTYQAAIVEGSFTPVKEQMAGNYAEKFGDQGSSRCRSTTPTTARARVNRASTRTPPRS